MFEPRGFGQVQSLAWQNLEKRKRMWQSESAQQDIVKETGRVAQPSNGVPHFLRDDTLDAA